MLQEEPKVENMNKSKGLTVILLSVYLIILTWIIVFKFSLSFSELPDLRGVNLIPFAGSVIVNGKIFYSELVLNILAFVPFGVYLSMLKPELHVGKRVLWIAVVSLLYEILQFIFAIGASDITDLMNNTLGGVIGCIIFTVFSKVFKQRTNKVLNVLALIGTIGMILLLGLLILNNL